MNDAPLPWYVAGPVIAKVAAARFVLTEIVPVVGTTVYIPENKIVPPAAKVFVDEEGVV
jgi:hypothetical protein